MMRRFPKLFRAIILALCVLFLAGGGFALFLYRETVILPVLNYHHFADSSDSYLVVSESRFDEQMRALSAAGRHTVTIAQLVDYAEQGIPLPDKPVLITMDDGYASNLEVAAPILKKYGFHAVVFSVGCYAGEDGAGRTQEPPYFALSQAREWIDEGVLEIQSHSFDLHTDEYGREGMLPEEDESPEHYRAVLAEDCQKQRELFSAVLGYEPAALAYPYGKYEPSTQEAMEEEGIKATFTMLYDYNRLRRGDPATLHTLSRFPGVEEYGPDEILRLMHPGVRRRIQHFRHYLEQLT